MEINENITHVFKEKNQVFTLSCKLLKLSNTDSSECNSFNKFSIKIESENKEIFTKEFNLEELHKEDSTFKKFELTEIFEMISINCSEKTVVFEKNDDKCFVIVLKTNINKKNFTPKITIPQTIKNSPLDTNNGEKTVDIQNLVMTISSLEAKI